MKARVTLRKETGSRGVGDNPRGWDICVNGNRVGSVSACGGGVFTGPLVGWYFSVGNEPLLGLKFTNTAGTPMPLDATKAAALAYVKSAVAAHNACQAEEKTK